jgi:uncharacterized alpha/beta hydrolase family protein
MKKNSHFNLRKAKIDTLTKVAVIVCIIFIILIIIYVGGYFITPVQYENNSIVKNSSGFFKVLKHIDNHSVNNNHSIPVIRENNSYTNLNNNNLLYNSSKAAYCGDSICQNGEMGNCYKDCYWCGDGYCDGNDSCENCPIDCGSCNESDYCGNGICTPEKCKEGCTKDCKVSNCIDNICETRIGENCLNSADCSCGIGEYCDSSDFTCKGSYCGNGLCDANESCGNCADCVCDILKKCTNDSCQTFCGNGVCEKSETKESCPADCGSENYKEDAVDPNTDYPIIFVHGHSIFEEDVTTYSINGFLEFQKKLDSDGLYRNIGVILPNDNIDYYLPGEWGRYGKPISVRTSYYTGILSPQNVFISNDEARRSINEYAQRLERVVDIVIHHTGKNKVIIIGHSMGGLVARAYIKNYNGESKVDKLIMIGTPNHGYYTQDLLDSDITKYFGCGQLHPGQECGDMEPGSNFLNKLNSGDETPGDIKYLSIIGSCCDNNGDMTDQVVRVNSAKLEGAKNVIVNGDEYTDLFDTLHQELIYPSKVPKVYNEVKQFLATNSSA